MEKFLSVANYYEGVANAVRNKGGKKRKYWKARYVRDHVEELKDYFLNEAAHFKNDKHPPKVIYDGIRKKQRTILVPTMREQVIHHMVVNVLKPIFLKGMYEHSYGSIPGRGALKGRKNKRKNNPVKSGQATIEKWIHRDRKGMKYCLKMDIRKYFDSIPHAILKRKLADIIHDPDFLAVLYEIVDAIGTEYGIPLGFYTSQWIANWYLTELDHYIKERLKAAHYIRYMDDMVIFHGNKRELHEIRREIASYLADHLGLKLKDNWQVFLFDYVKSDGKHVGHDLDFMGVRFFRDKTILRKSIMLKATRKVRRMCRKARATIYDCKQMMAYQGWVSATNTYMMYAKYIKPYVSFRYLRKRISLYQLKLNRRDCYVV